MKCMYYLAPSLVSTHQISDDLHDVGIDDWHVHVVSKDEAGLKKTLEAVGVPVDDTKIKATVAALNGVDIDKTIAETAIASAPTAPTDGGEKKAEAKPEESKEDVEKKEAEAAAGLGALFG